MKRRILSFIIVLALCLNLCPVQALAAGEEVDGGACLHHPAHIDECRYVPGSPGAPCTFACQICPVEDLIRKLPGSVSESSSELQAQLSEIYALYDGLTAEEQQQVDLSPCMSLQEQLDGMGLMALSDDSGDGGSIDQFILGGNYSSPTPYVVLNPLRIRTNGYTFTGTNSTAIQVIQNGKLYLSGTVIAQGGAGVEVQSGGFLSITEPETSISSTTYALDIASGAQVHLSAGTYTGRFAAIRIADDCNLSGFLEEGYACFDGSGNPLLPADAAKTANKTIVIGQCPSHPNKTCTHTSGTTTHTWTCPYCGVEETEACTFDFDETGSGTCACNNKIVIVVDESDLTGLVYDGTVKAEDVSIGVTLNDGSNKVLKKGTDYEVAYVPRTDAGEITVTVTGLTFNGTFTRTYHVEQAQPGICWDAATWAVDYDSRGIPVDSASLPHITITITASEDLHPYLQYCYRKTGETEFTAGLPTNAGKYEIKAYLPESQNYKAAETENLLTLTINKIPAVATAPTAKTLTYNREAQELVTAGVLKPGAIAEGAKIEYKLETNGNYSTDIPTGVDVSKYDVSYRVSETGNYSGVSETLVSNPNPTLTYTSARINHREIKPTLELEYYTTLYDGGYKEPGVTVKDGEYVIPNSEYTVTYSNNRDVSDTAPTVTVKNADRGNYTLTTATATFKITLRNQESLTITNKPSTFTYGDVFTLGTEGGAGNGTVT